MFKPVQVKPLPSYRLWLKYADGVAGEVNLSHLAGKGVFALWNDYAAFERVYYEALINVNTLAVMAGRLPARALGLVIENDVDMVGL